MRIPSRIAPVLPWLALVAAAEPLRDPAYAEEIGARAPDLYPAQGGEGKPRRAARPASRP
ncbi:MAG TPA: hypothetical protein VFC77_00775 [Myxococcota bacterium]|nr:hypothetical protein [Myxococcota bacterium]